MNETVDIQGQEKAGKTREPKKPDNNIRDCNNEKKGAPKKPKTPCTGN
ncbi:hypothetical protein [Altericista sp. CCNU0014]